MDIVLSLAVSIIGGIIVIYGYDKSPRLARWLIQRSASRLQDRDRWEQEWLSDLEYKDGKFDMLLHGFGCAWAGLVLEPISIPRVLGWLMAFPILSQIDRLVPQLDELEDLTTTALRSKTQVDCECAAVYAERLQQQMKMTRYLVKGYSLVLDKECVASIVELIDLSENVLSRTAKKIRLRAR